jgi:hypothetical protein
MELLTTISFQTDLLKIPYKDQKKFTKAVKIIQSDPFVGSGKAKKCFKHKYSNVYPTVVSTSTLGIDQNISDSFFSIDFKSYDDDQLDLGNGNLQHYNRITMEAFNSHCGKLREELASRNRRLIDIRISSIKQTNELLIRHIEEQLKNLVINRSDERIIRMKTRQKENLLFKMEKQLEELEKKKEISIETDPIAGGIIVAE